MRKVLSAPGKPLDTTTRTDMEARLGHDFGRIRVHADGTAGRASEALAADAWTVGRHVAFAPGLYRSDTEVGRALLAHELVHTIQQGQVDAPPHGALEVSRPGDPAERAVEALSPSPGSGRPRIARREKPKSPEERRLDEMRASQLKVGLAWGFCFGHYLDERTMSIKGVLNFVRKYMDTSQFQGGEITVRTRSAPEPVSPSSNKGQGGIRWATRTWLSERRYDPRTKKRVLDHVIFEVAADVWAFQFLAVRLVRGPLGDTKNTFGCIFYVTCFGDRLTFTSSGSCPPPARASS